jgi:hypothetical protein
MKLFIPSKHLFIALILLAFVTFILFYFFFNFNLLKEKEVVDILYNVGNKIFSKEGYIIFLPSNSLSKFPEKGVGKISKTNFTSLIYLGASGFANKIAAFVYDNTEIPKQVFDNFSILESYYSYESNTSIENLSLNLTGVKFFKITTFISKNITFTNYGFALVEKNVIFLGTVENDSLAINMATFLLDELKNNRI